MNENYKKNNRTLIIIFALSIIPFAFAWYLAATVSWSGKGTNKGQLITPAVPTARSEFKGFDDFSTKHIKEIEGRWVIINVLPEKECSEVCQEAIHKTKQLRLMMSKELTRIRRLVLIFSEIDKKRAAQCWRKDDLPPLKQAAQCWWKDDLRLLKIKPTASLIEKLKTIRKSDIPEGMLFLMDPLGNLMMQYDPGFDPYQVKSDLKKLLRISQIG